MKNQPFLATRLFFGAAGFVVGATACVLVYFIFYHQTDSIITALRQSDLNSKDRYKFIDPLLALKGTSALPPDFATLQNDINSIIESETKKGNLISASVVVRDINRPASIYINDSEKYSPASLLKVPIMIAYFKMAEGNSSVLQKQILYTGKIDKNNKESIKSQIKLTPDTWYSVDDLIQHMIKYSDNNATSLLTQNLNTSENQNFVNDLFNDLGIREISTVNDFLTVRDYNLFFRVLYNSTYLGRTTSERALKLLSEGDFTQGISSGVPYKEIIISQKFGEFSLVSPKGDLQRREFHNCGIVYYPQHPYMLCIMTKGTDFNKLKNVVSNISSTVFNHIQSYYSF